MLHPQGYVTVIGPQSFELDTITCGHCNQIVFVKPNTVSTIYYLPQLVGPPTEEPGAGCRCCGRAICLTCYDDGRCLPLERQIEAMELHGLRMKAMGR